MTDETRDALLKVARGVASGEVPLATLNAAICAEIGGGTRSRDAVRISTISKQTLRILAMLRDHPDMCRAHIQMLDDSVRDSVSREVRWILSRFHEWLSSLQRTLERAVRSPMIRDYGIDSGFDFAVFGNLYGLTALECLERFLETVALDRSPPSERAVLDAVREAYADRRDMEDTVSESKSGGAGFPIEL